ncbi:glutamine--fructose-6-phosphate transaminase (isomerizing) [Patescibacteria group bacterium]|nr:glutamine--fructose-6-phosphate transaminase (isomerizing) [Patescibacteria group bacterium]
MCGIVGYIGHSTDIRIGMEALKRLEYRGYDSAGMAVYNKDRKEVDSVKAVGKVANLEEKLQGMNLKGSPFLFYTRWATHGGVTEENCHPHTDCKQNIWVAHNGIIENYRQLKEELSKEGHVFVSETDTEVIPHLIEKFFEGNLEEATRKALSSVRGAYALAIIAKDDPEKLVLAKYSAPLLIGLGKDEYLAASDPSAVITHTNKVVYLEDGELAVLTPESFSIQDYRQNHVSRQAEKIDWSLEDAKKGGYAHFMLKEIMEQPESIQNALRGRMVAQEGTAKLGGLEDMEEKLREIERVQILACGTASFMGRVGEYMIEEYVGLSCEVDIGSEFRYRKPVIDKRTLTIAISQSGETADTLAALKEAKRKGSPTVGIVNVVGSSVAREVDVGVYTHAGPEVAVASTKASTAQLAVLSLLTLFLGRQRQLSLVMGQRIAKELSRIPELVKSILERDEEVKRIAEKYKEVTNLWVIGRKYNYPIALEGALKIKETSYVHAEGIAGGELKHGALALVDEDFLTIAIVPSDSVYEKMISNIQEIKARKGPVVTIATEGNKDIASIADDVIYIPKTLEMLTPILSVIPLQLFAYYMGVLKGYDVDRPRNLAKSVTVE